MNMNVPISFISISSSNLNWVKRSWKASLAFLGSWNANSIKIETLKTTNITGNFTNSTRFLLSERNLKRAV